MASSEPIPELQVQEESALGQTDLRTDGSQSVQRQPQPAENSAHDIQEQLQTETDIPGTQTFETAPSYGADRAEQLQADAEPQGAPQTQDNADEFTETEPPVQEAATPDAQEIPRQEEHTPAPATSDNNGWQQPAEDTNEKQEPPQGAQ
jgi:hypothetical protein